MAKGQCVSPVTTFYFFLLWIHFPLNASTTGKQNSAKRTDTPWWMLSLIQEESGSLPWMPTVINIFFSLKSRMTISKALKISTVPTGSHSFAWKDFLLQRNLFSFCLFCSKSTYGWQWEMQYSPSSQLCLYCLPPHQKDTCYMELMLTNF